MGGVQEWGLRHQKKGQDKCLGIVDIKNYLVYGREKSGFFYCAEMALGIASRRDVKVNSTKGQKIWLKTVFKH